MTGVDAEDADFLQGPAAEFLLANGLTADGGWSLLRGGRNNRLYRGERQGRAVVLKRFYQDSAESHDRYEAEARFYDLAERAAAEFIPPRLAHDRGLRLALYEYLPGSRLPINGVDRADVDRALQFVLQIHRAVAKSAPLADQARQLPNAAESCFSLADHLSCVETRVARLETIPETDSLTAAARRLAVKRLRPALRHIEAAVLQWATDSGRDPDRRLSQKERCISPSDFGFHNALPDAQGKLRFFDFEYAGWDDPAKMACDFFCQVAVPAPQETWEHFATSVMQLFARPAFARERMDELLPLYRLKWCCIVLNPFLPGANARRAFGGAEELAEEQLALAERIAQQLPPSPAR